MEIVFKVEKRDSKEGVGELRDSGMTPGVLYGAGKGNIDVKATEKDLRKVLEGAGESSLVTLSVDGDKAEHILIQDVEFDPVSDKPLHFDLLRVKMDEKIEAEVELEFRGVSAAVKDEGGVLVKSIDSVEVKALPIDLPKEIQVDISPLKTFDDVIKISDLQVSDKVEILEKPDEVVATVTPPRSEEELAELDEAVEEDIEDVEVEEKGKEEEEDEEGGEKDESAEEKEVVEKPGEGDEKKPKKEEKKE